MVASKSRLTLCTKRRLSSPELSDRPPNRKRCCGGVQDRVSRRTKGAGFNKALSQITQPPETLYSTIRPGCIRLLALAPGKCGSALHGRFEVAVMTPEPGADLPYFNFNEGINVQYTALSYTWGDARRDDPEILISGMKKSIRRNLYEFLQVFRHRSDTRRLWIDALCINQDNDKEKAIQVGSMLSVYRNAEIVVAWLGEGNTNSDTAMQYMQQFEPAEAMHHDRSLFAENLDELSAGATDLFTREWIHRVWILQEVWAATKLMVWCGTETISWARYMDWATVFIRGCENPNLPLQPRLDGSQIKALRTLKDLTRECGQLKPLLDLLMATIGFKSTFSRDRVFALQGMACKEDRVKVEYSGDAGEFWAGFWKHMMTENGTHTIFCLPCKSGSYRERIPEASERCPRSRHDQCNHQADAHPSWSLDITTLQPLRGLKGLKQQGNDMLGRNHSLNRYEAGSTDVLSLNLLAAQYAMVEKDASSGICAYFSPDRLGVCQRKVKKDETILESLPEYLRLSAVPVRRTFNRMEVQRRNQKDPRFFVPLHTKKGDRIMLIEGTILPVVLRPTTHDEPDRFSFVGYAVPQLGQQKPPELLTSTLLSRDKGWTAMTKVELVSKLMII